MTVTSQKHTVTVARQEHTVTETSQKHTVTVARQERTVTESKAGTHTLEWRHPDLSAFLTRH